MTVANQLVVLVAAILCWSAGFSPILDAVAEGASERLVLAPTAFRTSSGLVLGERGRFQVQENRLRRDSRLIEIAFVRFRHPEPSDEAPIVYLPGGPGQPVLQAIDHFAASYQAYVEMGGRGDMLVVEQRGVGASRPRLLCPGVLARPTDGALSAAIMGATHVAYVQRCIEHWVEKGVDLAGYNVGAMADDVDQLRAALGYHKIKLFGESFGTHHALALIRNHGDRIERAALTAVIGPDDMFEKPFAIDRQLRKLGAMAKNDPALGGHVQDLQALMTSALDRLDQPSLVAVPGDDGERLIEVGRYDLSLATVSLLRQTAFLRQLPLLYQRIRDGDLAWLANWSAKVRDGQQTDLASLAITCASGASAERRAEIRDQAAISPFGDAVDLLSADVCTPFDDLDLERPPNTPVTGGMPVLMVSGELDPRAPPANAEALLSGLPKARHVVFPGVSHDFGSALDGLLDLIYRFLAHGETEPRRRLPGFTFAPLS